MREKEVSLNRFRCHTYEKPASNITTADFLSDLCKISFVAKDMEQGMVM